MDIMPSLSIYIGAVLRSGFTHVDNVIPVIKTVTWLLLSRLQGNKPQRNSPEPSKPCLRNLHSPEPSGTFGDLPEPTFRNLPEPTSKTYGYTGTLRNLPEPSGTCLRNLHHFTPELSGTFWNLPPEPTPAYAGTLRNLPEPSSGTCSCDPHRHTPELIWAEDPISLRCWGKTPAERHVTCWCLRH